MLVSSRFDPTTKSWEIVALEGTFEGVIVATCDAITLRECSFSNDVIFGHPTAIWGATLNPELVFDVYTLRGLGINRSFKNTGRHPALFNGEHYVDKHTNAVLVAAQSVALFRSGIQYGD